MKKRKQKCDLLSKHVLAYLDRNAVNSGYQMSGCAAVPLINKTSAKLDIISKKTRSKNRSCNKLNGI